MNQLRMFAAGLLAATVLSGAAAAQSENGGVKIGLIYTLSGPAAVLGEQGRDGFLLAMEHLDGKLGGMDAEIIVVDDELKPDVAVNRARELVEREGADIVVGPIFSNIMQAIARPVTEGGAFLISSNAGPSNFAGEECHENIFVTSYQNDQNHEVLGRYAEDQGHERAFLLAPNYQAGKDSLAGFKRSFEGEVVAELYTPVGQLDFSAELAQLAAAQPDVFFTFMPGGMGVNLVKQYRQAGLDTIPFLSAFTVDETTLPAQQEAAVGFFGGSNWAPDMDNEPSRAFVEAFEAKYDRVPGSYAMHAYDTARLIDSALAKVDGNLEDQDAIRAALREADIESLRGDFRFGNNHYPIQDFYLVEVAEREDGKYQTEIAEKIFDDYQDTYSSECPMEWE